MSSLVIQGLGSSPIPFNVDTTSQYIASLYQGAVNVFATIFNKRITDPNYQFTTFARIVSSDPNNPIPESDQSDYTQLQDAYNQLVVLTQGVTVPGQSGVQRLNFQMATQMDVLFKTLAVNGLDTLFQGGDAAFPGTPSDVEAAKLTALQGWWNLAPAGLGKVINSAVAVGASWQSIQAMIELDFVKQGNDLISNQLSSLQTALQQTDQAVQFLTRLQNMYNMVTPAPTESIGGVGGSGATFVHNYISAGDNAFSSPISVVSTATSADNTKFQQMKTELTGLITSVMQTAGFSSSDISGVLTSNTVPPLNSSGVDAYTGSLAEKLKGVLDAMNSAGTLQNFIVDNQGSTAGIASAGDYGRTLSAAQVASQSLNDTQTQQVNQSLFLFQQFYQAASGMLTSLTQIIQSMAQAAGR